MSTDEHVDYGGAGYYKRDPRVDPRPGDRLKDKYGQEIVIRELATGEERDMKVFRKAMRGAQVLKVAKNV